MSLFNLDHQMKNRPSLQLHRNGTLEVNQLYEVSRFFIVLPDGDACSTNSHGRIPDEREGKCS